MSTWSRAEPRRIAARAQRSDPCSDQRFAGYSDELRRGGIHLDALAARIEKENPFHHAIEQPVQTLRADLPAHFDRFPAAHTGDHQRRGDERPEPRDLHARRMLRGRGKTVTEIAHDLNLSVKTVSPHRSHILAKTMLHTNAELASRLGYQSEAAFSRAFKRFVGVAPGAVRRNATQ